MPPIVVSLVFVTFEKAFPDRVPSFGGHLKRSQEMETTQKLFCDGGLWWKTRNHNSPIIYPVN